MSCVTDTYQRASPIHSSFPEVPPGCSLSASMAVFPGLIAGLEEIPGCQIRLYTVHRDPLLNTLPRTEVDALHAFPKESPGNDIQKD
jgi:hypothetical protein